MTSPDPTSTPTSVYRYFDANDLLIYVGITSRGMARNSEHNNTKEWWPFVARQEVSHHPNREEALDTERRLIRKHLPPFNSQHNPHHHQSRRSYLQIAAALDASRRGSTAAKRRTKRSRLPLSVLSDPMPGHDITLYSSPLDADVIGGQVLRQSGIPLVHTPQRKRAGVVIDVKSRGGVLLVGIQGRYLPSEITVATAALGIQTKPAGFYVKSVTLNDANQAVI